jgi:23S rRNA (uracil1939-C5)-methyltransferase
MSNTKTKIVEIELTGLAHKGAAVGRTDEGLVVFVKDAVPGDRVKAMLTKKRKGTWTANLLEIIRRSEQRTQAICQHFGICGGCSWQNLKYAEQLRQKEILVKDAICRIGKVEPERVESILPALHTEYYRNKMEYTFSCYRWLTEEEIQDSNEMIDQKALGLHRPGHFNKVVDIQTCYLQMDSTNKIRNFIRDYSIERQLEFYDIKQQKGFLRNVIFKSNSKAEMMCILVFHEEKPEIIVDFTSVLRSNFPEIVSMYYVINPKKNDSYFDLTFHKVFGLDYLSEHLDHARFLIGPKSFFQTNPEQAARLYKLVGEFANLKGHEVVYDLYCGVGSIGIYLAKNASRVIGIEEIPEAINDANLNAAENDLTNCHFYVSDTKDIKLQDLIKTHGQPDIIIVDPPRAGMHGKVIEQLLDLSSEKIIYVSCNPATQARDIQLLHAKYQVEKVKPVDMFPHTNHVEAVALLSLRK